MSAMSVHRSSGASLLDMGAAADAASTTGRLVKEISSLKEELQMLEDEEERIRKTKAEEHARKEQERRRKQQLEEEAKIRETIELRKYQEDQRKDRLKRMREEARLQEYNRQQKEKQYQQIQWELTSAKTAAEIENSLKKRKEMEEQHSREAVALQDSSIVASRQRLTAILDDMRKELHELGQDDWMKKLHAKQAKHEKRLEHERVLREKEAQDRQAHGGGVSRRKILHERDVVRSEIAALRDEMKMLERDERMEDLRRSARERHQAETCLAHAAQQNETTRVTHERQATQAEADARADAEKLSGEIQLQGYLVQKQEAQATIASEHAERRRREVASLQALRQEREDEEQVQRAAEAEGFHRDLERVEGLEGATLAGGGGGSGSSSRLREMVAEQRLARREDGSAPLDDVAHFSAEVSGMYAQLAAEEIRESRQRLAMLRHEQAVQQERGAVLKLEADRARDAEQRLAEDDRVRAEEEQRQRTTDASCRRYEEGMHVAARDRDRVRGASRACRASLVRLEAEEAAEAARAANARELETANEIRSAEGRLLDANAARRRAEGDAAAAKRQLRELEREQEAAARADAALADAARHAAAVVLQGFARVVRAKRTAAVLWELRRARDEQGVREGAATVVQQACRRASALERAERRREEAAGRRAEKARELLRRIEEEEGALDGLQARLRDAPETREQQVQTTGASAAAAAAAATPAEAAAAAAAAAGRVAAAGSDPGERLSDLEDRVELLTRELAAERCGSAEREARRHVRAEAAAEEALESLGQERDLQAERADTLAGLLEEHGAVIEELQRQLQAATAYGPYEEDALRGESAVCIQAAWRGSRVRQAAGCGGVQQRRAAREEARRTRELAALALVESEAATAIQGMLRVSAARGLRRRMEGVRAGQTEAARRDGAAVALQCWARGAAARARGAAAVAVATQRGEEEGEGKEGQSATEHPAVDGEEAGAVAEEEEEDGEREAREGG